MRAFGFAPLLISASRSRMRSCMGSSPEALMLHGLVAVAGVAVVPAAAVGAAVAAAPALVEGPGWLEAAGVGGRGLATDGPAPAGGAASLAEPVVFCAVAAAGATAVGCVSSRAVAEAVALAFAALAGGWGEPAGMV